LLSLLTSLVQAAESGELGRKRLELREIERRIQDQRLNLKALEGKAREHEVAINDASEFLERKTRDGRYFEQIAEEIGSEIALADAARRRSEANLAERDAKLRPRLAALASLAALSPQSAGAQPALREGAEALRARCRQLARQVQMERENLDSAVKTLARLHDAQARYKTFEASARGRSSTIESGIQRRRESLERIAALRRQGAETMEELESRRRQIDDLVSNLKQRYAAAGAAPPAPPPVRPPDGATQPKPAEPAEPPRSASERSAFSLVLEAELDAPVRAVEGGLVWYAGPLTGWGNLVVLHHEDGVVSVYGHLQNITARPGINVYRGQIIGRAGPVKNGAGVRFEIRRVEDEDRTVPLDQWKPTQGDLRAAIFGTPGSEASDAQSR
jgi:murein DD-endopeptidase MepM/ murein hydrolase activator NlpD